MVKINETWRNKAIKLLEKANLNGGHLDAAMGPLIGQESRFPSVNNMIHNNQNLTPEQYVDYFKSLQISQKTKFLREK